MSARDERGSRVDGDGRQFSAGSILVSPSQWTA
jgi:hypothetical protein